MGLGYFQATTRHKPYLLSQQKPKCLDFFQYNSLLTQLSTDTYVSGSVSFTFKRL